MQNLDVISVNLWQMLVSLVNLVILFLLIKKFLYKPVKKMLESRQSTIDGTYSEAEKAKAEALADKAAYEEKLSGAKGEAEAIIQNAVTLAKARESEIVADAREEAASILHEARENAELELKRAEDMIRDEIVDVSALLTEKMLRREINAEDHKELIDSFIEEIGDEDGTDQ